jgi:ABC-type Fe3+-hydroxamate transport system, periplasmic component
METNKQNIANIMKKVILWVLFAIFQTIGAYAVPKRIIVLSPAGSEILCALGAYNQIVARTDYCDFPEELKKVQSVGGFDGKTLSLEKILACKPDFVYGSKGMHDYLVTPLKKVGIPVYLSDANSIDAVIKEIKYIGTYTGHSKEAVQIENDIIKTIDSVQKRSASSKKVKVYYEVWNSPFMSAGKTSFISEMIHIAGGENIFASLNEEYPMVSEEAIIVRQPDVILIPDMENETLASIEKRNGWQTIPAVRNKKIYFIDSNICSRPGPRITQAIVIIAKQLHPEINYDDLLVQEDKK